MEIAAAAVTQGGLFQVSIVLQPAAAWPEEGWEGANARSALVPPDPVP